jgi:hypothetical protein
VVAEHAIVRMEKSNDGGTVTLTMSPGWEHVLPQTFEEDPACLIIWDDDNILATVNNFNVAIANRAAPPGWFNVVAGHPITIPGLKNAILTVVQGAAGGGGVVGNCMIAPNSIPQYVKVYMLFQNVGFDPFFPLPMRWAPLDATIFWRTVVNTRRLWQVQSFLRLHSLVYLMPPSLSNGGC